MSAGTDRPSDVAGRLVAGRYRLISLIGRGGMGSVWQAQDELLDREVAVKEVDIPHGIPADEREELRQRSLREARTTARLRHPSAVTVHDVVLEGDHPYIVMEHVRSRSLQDVSSEEGPLPVHQVAEIGLAVLGALRAAHAAGVLHRDVKPSNVLLGADGRVVLTDFGIARYEGDVRMTMTGRIMGSSGYIAPELLQGVKAATPACDLWALGVTLYVAVEGRQPYAQEGFIERLTAAATQDPDPMRLAGPLAPLITGLMARDPASRLDGAEAERMLRDAARAPAATGVLAAPAGAEAAKTVRAGARGSGAAGTVTTPPVATTAGQHAAPPAPPATGAPAGARSRRRRGALVATLLILAVAVGAGVAAGSALLQPRRDGSVSASATPAEPVTRAPSPATTGGNSATPKQPASPPASPTAGPAGRAGFAGPFRTHRDASFGFVALVPAGWQPRTEDNFTLFTQPGVGPRPDILVSVGPSEAGGPEATLDRVEREFAAKLPADQRYQRIRRASFGGPEGKRIGEWEFSYLRELRAGVRWRVLERAVETPGGALYIIRFRFPAAQWEAGAGVRAQFVRSFQVNPVASPPYTP